MHRRVQKINRKSRVMSFWPPYPTAFAFEKPALYVLNTFIKWQQVYSDRPVDHRIQPISRPKNHPSMRSTSIYSVLNKCIQYLCSRSISRSKSVSRSAQEVYLEAYEVTTRICSGASRPQARPEDPHETARHATPGPADYLIQPILRPENQPSMRSTRMWSVLNRYIKYLCAQ